MTENWKQPVCMLQCSVCPCRFNLGDSIFQEISALVLSIVATGGVDLTSARSEELFKFLTKNCVLVIFNVLIQLPS